MNHEESPSSPVSRDEELDRLIDNVLNAREDAVKIKTSAKGGDPLDPENDELGGW